MACEQGCRLAFLAPKDFSQCLKRMGLEDSIRLPQWGRRCSEEDGIKYIRRKIVIRKVPVFRHLSHYHAEMLAKSFESHWYAEGEFVVKQGEVGSTFYVVAHGEVEVTIDGRVIRTMGQNAYFGERALLFDEPRTASVEVKRASKLLSVEKSVFCKIVQGKMRSQLMERIRLQDTNVTLKDLKHVQVIGTGGYGIVRMVIHKGNGMRYALKRVKTRRGKIPTEVEREMQLLAENDHPFVVQMVKTFETSRGVYMLTELVTGGELHAAIRAIPTALSRTQAQFYIGSLVLVLEELAGRNIIYRDLKPENVMLDLQGYLKLIDFGIAKKLEHGRVRTYTSIGTPHYMAPEVYRGAGYGALVDIWSLGIILYELVCGYLPFANNNHNNHLEVCQAVMKAPLEFPAKYTDKAGRKLIEGMLERQPTKRSGSGINGFEEDIKGTEFFKAGHPDQSIFDKLMSRSLDAPVVPKGETYSAPEDVADSTLSDCEELG